MFPRSLSLSLFFSRSYPFRCHRRTKKHFGHRINVDRGARKYWHSIFDSAAIHGYWNNRGERRHGGWNFPPDPFFFPRSGFYHFFFLFSFLLFSRPFSARFFLFLFLFEQNFVSFRFEDACTVGVCVLTRATRFSAPGELLLVMLGVDRGLFWKFGKLLVLASREAASFLF